MNVQSPRIEVSIANQTLSFWEGHRLVKQWPCSTSKFGIGFKEGSNCTPLGGFRIMEKHGAGADEFTVFKARVPIWQWSPDDVTDADLILARILWLEGTEARNANTKERYIYIHGTNGEDKIGQRASHGCIRMRNADVVSLFEIAEVGMPVWIGE